MSHRSSARRAALRKKKIDKCYTVHNIFNFKKADKTHEELGKAILQERAIAPDVQDKAVVIAAAAVKEAGSPLTTLPTIPEEHIIDKSRLAFISSKVDEARHSTVASWKDKDAWLGFYGLKKVEVKNFIASLNGAFISPYMGKKGKYEKKRLSAEANFDYHPWGIVMCTGLYDVLAALNFSLAHQHPGSTIDHIPTSIRSGGHSYGGYCVVNKGLVIDLSKMNQVSIVEENGEKFAEVGPGTRFKKLYRDLDAFGLHVPGGTCPDVGVGGFTQGGGFGYTSRKYGVACDSLVGATVITVSEKKKVRVHFAKPGSDLLWAIQGGTGGNYGIIVSLKYKTRAVKPMVWGMSIVYPIELAADALLAWQNHFTWIKPEEEKQSTGRKGGKKQQAVKGKKKQQASLEDNEDFSFFYNLTFMDTTPEGMNRRWEESKTERTPDEIETNLVPRDAPVKSKELFHTCEIDGVFLKGNYSEEKVKELIRPLLAVFEKGTPYWQDLKNNHALIIKKIAFADAVMWLDDSDGDDLPDYEYSERRSSYTVRPWLKDDAERLIKGFTDPKTTYADSISFEGYGGQVNRVNKKSTAFVHRDVYFNCVAETGWNNNKEKKRGLQWIDDQFKIFKEETPTQKPMVSSQVYQNYPTSQRYKFPLETVLDSYFGSNLPRLKTIKKLYNPLDLYHYAQAVEETVLPAQEAPTKAT